MLADISLPIDDELNLNLPMFAPPLYFSFSQQSFWHFHLEENVVFWHLDLQFFSLQNVTSLDAGLDIWVID